MKRVIVYSLLIFVYVFGLVLLYAPKPLLVEQGSIDYFSCFTINCSSLLIQFLEQSPQTYCAFYDLDEPSVIDALQEYATVKLFDEHIIEGMHPVSSKGLMHHKFCVFDEQYVLTGTWNPTIRGTYYNDNIVLLIDSSFVAQSYLSEYNSLGSNVKSELVKVLLDEVYVETLFCPECEQRIVEEINLAKNSIDILAFYFSSEGVATALIDAYERNVSIRVIFEKTRVSKYSVLEILADVGMEVYVDGNSYTMHEKMFLIDNQTIIVGSYNPTKGATTVNEENVLIIKNDVDGITFMVEEFERIRKEAVLV